MIDSRLINSSIRKHPEGLVKHHSALLENAITVHFKFN